MQVTGFFHWGFVIYRCDYSDDSLFDRFITCIRDNAETWHQEFQQDRTTGLPIYPQWTIVQDREGLDKATKDQVRQRFVEWRDGLSVKRDGPGADHRITPYLPRFEYCVHVGRDSLDSLIAHEQAPRAGQNKYEVPPVLFAIVRAEQMLAGLPEGYDSDEEDAEDGDLANVMSPIEGCTDDDVGWMYAPANHWVTLYEELHNDEAWYYMYTRPPGIVKL